MSCETIDPELIAYHFGTVPLGSRGEIEGHLKGCARCLDAFLAIKRDLETAEGEASPSPTSRERLRRVVAQQIAPSVSRPRRRWERPFAFGAAAAALFSAVVVAHSISTGPGAAPRMHLRQASPAALDAQR